MAVLANQGLVVFRPFVLPWEVLDDDPDLLDLLAFLVDVLQLLKRIGARILYVRLVKDALIV